jgi:hypothetical protein
LAQNEHGCCSWQYAAINEYYFQPAKVQNIFDLPFRKIGRGDIPHCRIRKKSRTGFLHIFHTCDNLNGEALAEGKRTLNASSLPQKKSKKIQDFETFFCFSTYKKENRINESNN